MSLLQIEALQIHRVGKRLSPQTILENLTIHLEIGDVMGIFGDAGSGKTILSQAIAFQLPKGLESTGTILLEGKEQRKLEKGTGIVRIGDNAYTYLPPFQNALDFAQNFVLAHYPHTPVLEARERLLNRAHLLGLLIPEKLQIPYVNLTRMEKIAMTIAVGTLLDPHVLILDSSLDCLEKDERRMVAIMIRNLLNAGVIKGMLFLSRRDVDSMDFLCTHAKTLYAGQVMESGGAGQLLHTPCHPYTQMLWDNPNIEGLRASVLDASPTAGCVYANQCPQFTPECLHSRIPFRTVFDHDVRCIYTPVETQE